MLKCWNWWKFLQQLKKEKPFLIFSGFKHLFSSKISIFSLKFSGEKVLSKTFSEFWWIWIFTFRSFLLSTLIEFSGSSDKEPPRRKQTLQISCPQSSLEGIKWSFLKIWNQVDLMTDLKMILFYKKSLNFSFTVLGR